MSAETSREMTTNYQLATKNVPAVAQLETTLIGRILSREPGPSQKA